MPILYMTIWSLAIIAALAFWRLRRPVKILVVLLVTAFILLLSQTLFVQLAVNAGLDPSHALSDPWQFLAVGPLGWLALLVMPCGWLGPVVGLNLVQRQA